MQNNKSFMTKRVTVPELEHRLYEKIAVLDHGFIRIVDYMGDDSAIVQAARVSYGKGTKQVTQDKGLINYLMCHHHTTPFEMCEIKFHIKLPIFVARQWVRHRTASINEYSARYSILSNEFYLPAAQHLATSSSTNKQGRSDESMPADYAAHILALLKNDAVNCYQHYIEMLNEDQEGNIITEDKVGLSRELARMNLTLNYYTEWYWKINLHNLLHFLALRADSHAQYEIRVYAQLMLEIVKAWVPMVYDAFEEYRLHSVTLSRTAIAVIRNMLNGKTITQESSGMTKREWQELQLVIG